MPNKLALQRSPSIGICHLQFTVCRLKFIAYCLPITVAVIYLPSPVNVLSFCVSIHRLQLIVYRVLFIIFQSPFIIFWQLTSEISHLRLGLLTEGFSHPQSEPDVDQCIKRAAKHLATESGATLQDVSVPMHLDGKCNLYFVMSESNKSATLIVYIAITPFQSERFRDQL